MDMNIMDQFNEDFESIGTLVRKFIYRILFW